MIETDILQAINEFRYYKENGEFSSFSKTVGRDYARTKIGIYTWLNKKNKIDDELQHLINIEIEVVKGNPI